MTMKLTPFADDSASLSISKLMIENGTDQVSVYGSLDITRDKQGLDHALALKALLDQTVQILKADSSRRNLEVHSPHVISTILATGRNRLIPESLLIEGPLLILVARFLREPIATVLLLVGMIVTIAGAFLLFKKPAR